MQWSITMTIMFPRRPLAQNKHAFLYPRYIIYTIFDRGSIFSCENVPTKPNGVDIDLRNLLVCAANEQDKIGFQTIYAGHVSTHKNALIMKHVISKKLARCEHIV